MINYNKRKEHPFFKFQTFFECGKTLFVRLRRYENLAAGGKLIDKYLAPAEGPG